MFLFLNDYFYYNKNYQKINGFKKEQIVTVKRLKLDHLLYVKNNKIKAIKIYNKSA